MGKEGGGRGRQRRKSKKKKGRKIGGIVFCSLDVDTRGSKFHPLVVHSNIVGKGRREETGEKRGRRRRRIKKKIYSFVSAHCLPRFMIVGSVTDEISMPMEARPIFHIEIPLWYIQPGRVTYFSVLTSK